MELLEEYVIHASKMASMESYLRRVSGENTLAEDYLGPFHNEQYIPLWKMENGKWIMDNGMLQSIC